VTPPTVLTLFIPGKLENPTNGRLRSHWAISHRWARTWQERTAMVVHIEDTRRGTFRTLRDAVAKGATLEVTFEGRVARRFDDDGYRGCVKPVRDALAELFGTHDGPGAGHTWVYAPQVVERDKGKQGVAVTVAAQ
jgi:hypothetical protein